MGFFSMELLWYFQNLQYIYILITITIKDTCVGLSSLVCLSTLFHWLHRFNLFSALHIFPKAKITFPCCCSSTYKNTAFIYFKQTKSNILHNYSNHPSGEMYIYSRPKNNKKSMKIRKQGQCQKPWVSEWMAICIP